MPSHALCSASRQKLQRAMCSGFRHRNDDKQGAATVHRRARGAVPATTRRRELSRCEPSLAYRAIRPCHTLRSIGGLSLLLAYAFFAAFFWLLAMGLTADRER